MGTQMPTVFCGFLRRPGESPTLYPVACAAGVGVRRCVSLGRSCPRPSDGGAGKQTNLFEAVPAPFLPQVSIRDLKVGDATVDLLRTRHDEGDVGVNVLQRNGSLDVIVLK